MCSHMVTVNVGTPMVRLSQAYGAGGNTTAPLLNDFIEIYNAGTASQDLTGWSVQYAAATGVFSAANTTNLPPVMLAPGQYLLVQESNGGTPLARQTPAPPPAGAPGPGAMAPRASH